MNVPDSDICYLDHVQICCSQWLTFVTDFHSAVSFVALMRTSGIYLLVRITPRGFCSFRWQLYYWFTLPGTFLHHSKFSLHGSTTRMYSSRMRTARSLTISRRIPCTPPPATTHTPLQPWTPSTTMHAPQQPHMPHHNYTCPPATMHAPHNHAHPPTTMHAPLQTCMPPTTMHTAPPQPCTHPHNNTPHNHTPPCCNHACPHPATTHTSPATTHALPCNHAQPPCNHACPPATMHAPPREQND